MVFTLGNGDSEGPAAAHPADSQPQEPSALDGEERRVRRRLRLFAWLGVVSLLPPLFLVWIPGSVSCSGITCTGNAPDVLAIWALLGYSTIPERGSQFFFTPAIVGSPGVVSIATLFLVEFALLVAGCTLLFRYKRLGCVPFVITAVLESAVYAYAILSYTGPTYYYLPVGTVLAAITGVGSFVVTRRQTPILGQTRG